MTDVTAMSRPEPGSLDVMGDGSLVLLPTPGHTAGSVSLRPKARGKEKSMAIDALEAVQLGGITQWFRIRGADASNPVLLLMQQGPGLPMINEASRLEHLLGLERAFTVVYWDQRGTGLSLRQGSNGADISVARMVADTVSMLELLHGRFGGKTFVAGFSFGGTFAAYAAVQRPDLVAALVAAGMDIDFPAAENNTYDFALSAARQRGNRRAIRQLETIGPPPHLNAKQFTTRVRWAANCARSVQSRRGVRR
jgi:pimeloyl-ACP methyl ester carboxylesterase